MEVMGMQYGPSAERMGQPSAGAPPRGRAPASFFANEGLRQELLRRSIASVVLLDETDERAKGLPGMLQRYHSFYPLDDPVMPRGSKVCRGHMGCGSCRFACSYGVSLASK